MVLTAKLFGVVNPPGFDIGNDDYYYCELIDAETSSA